MKLFRLPTAIAAALLAASSATAATIINTGPADSQILYWGETDTATYGQTFTTPLVDTTLDSFTLSVANAGSAPTHFAFYVMGWDGAKATGPVLYSSAMQTLTSASMTSYTFTPNLSLIAGGSYVGFVNTSGFFDTVSNEATMASISSGDAYAGGRFVFLNHGSDFSQLTTQAWTQNWQGPGYDIAFEARFSSGNSVPDASSTVLMLGAAVLGLSRLRRRAV